MMFMISISRAKEEGVMPKRPTPPPGGRRVVSKSDLEPFFVFRPQDAVLGILVGVKPINGQDCYLFQKLGGQIGVKQNGAVVDAPNGVTGVLPSHVKLMDLLTDLQIGTKAWIEAAGEQELKNRAQPLRLYNVIDYGIPNAQAPLPLGEDEAGSGGEPAMDDDDNNEQIDDDASV
jgi:hypothetical protein